MQDIKEFVEGKILEYAELLEKEQNRLLQENYFKNSYTLSNRINGALIAYKELLKYINETNINNKKIDRNPVINDGGCYQPRHRYKSDRENNEGTPK